MNGKSDNRTHAMSSLTVLQGVYARTSCEIKHQSGETPTQSSIQYRHTITPPSAPVPPDRRRAGRQLRLPALAPRCFPNSCTVLVGFNPDAPLRAGSPGGPVGARNPWLARFPFHHEA